VLNDLTVSSGTNAVIASPANFANDDRAVIFENSGPHVVNVLDNDAAPAGTNLVITSISPPASGYVRIGNPATSLIYTPTPISSALTDSPIPPRMAMAASAGRWFRLKWASSSPDRQRPTCCRSWRWTSPTFWSTATARACISICWPTFS